MSLCGVRAAALASAEAGQTACQVSFPPGARNAAPDPLHAVQPVAAAVLSASAAAEAARVSADAHLEAQERLHDSGIPETTGASVVAVLPGVGLADPLACAVGPAEAAV